MTTLATHLSRKCLSGDDITFPVIAADIIYQGSAVGIESSGGYAQPLAAGKKFVGFNLFNTADNSAGAAGDIDVTVRTRGVIELPMSGLTQDDLGKPVFATDDNAFTLTNTTDAARIGTILKLSTTSGYAWVAFDAKAEVTPAAKITAPTGGATQDAESRAAINSILTALENRGIVVAN